LTFLEFFIKVAPQYLQRISDERLYKPQLLSDIFDCCLIGPTHIQDDVEFAWSHVVNADDGYWQVKITKLRLGSS